MRIHPLITKSDDLKALVDRLSKHPFIAVDTEFMRENTYWPDLCLVQVANPNEAAAIDPKAEIDLAPLLELFVKNRDVLKIFHAGGQDLEIIHNLTGEVPHPLFDTQIAAMALGHGEQIGYSNLIESLLGHSLDKGARFTDWARRPLDKRQIDYAIADVTHLATVFPRMVEKLRKTGRGAWLDEEMERLADSSSFAFPPEDAWKRLKLPKPHHLVLVVDTVDPRYLGRSVIGSTVTFSSPADDPSTTTVASLMGSPRPGIRTSASIRWLIPRSCHSSRHSGADSAGLLRARSQFFVGRISHFFECEPVRGRNRDGRVADASREHG